MLRSLTRHRLAHGTISLACLTLLSLQVSLANAQENAEESATESTTEQPSEIPEAPKLSLSDRQTGLRSRYSQFESSLGEIANYLQDTDPERADLLRRALGRSRSMDFGENMQDIAKGLKSESYGDAIRKQERVVTDMREVLELLRSQDRKKDLKAEQERIEALLKELKRLIGTEKDIRAATERGEDPDRLVERQQRAAEEVKDLAEKIKQQDAARDAENSDSDSNSQESENGKQGESSESKGSEPKEGEKKDGEEQEGEQKGGEQKDGEQSEGEQKPSDGMGKSGENSEGKPKDGEQKGEEGEKKDGENENDDEKSEEGEKKNGEQKDGEQKPSENSESKPSKGQSGKPSEGKPSESKPSESKPSDSKPSESKPSDQQQNSDQQQQSGDQQQQDDKKEKTPGRNEIEEAHAELERAIEELKRKNLDPASDRQDEAIAKLQAAKEKLEEILRQLREEELEMQLRALEARFQAMLRKQKEVYNGTVAVAGVAKDRWNSDHFSRMRELARIESEIVVEADKAYELLKEEGTSVAFKEATLSIRSDMRSVAVWLDDQKVGSLTQAVERDIIEALGEMVEALQKELEKMQDKKQQQQQQQQQQDGNQDLLNKLAELKMLRSLQKRVNRRTKLIGESVDGEQAVQADLVEQLRELSLRQDRIQEATYKLHTGRNQ